MDPNSGQIYTPVTAEQISGGVIPISEAERSDLEFWPRSMRFERLKALRREEKRGRYVDKKLRVKKGNQRVRALGMNMSMNRVTGELQKAGLSQADLNRGYEKMRHMLFQAGIDSLRAGAVNN